MSKYSKLEKYLILKAYQAHLVSLENLGLTTDLTNFWRPMQTMWHLQSFKVELVNILFTVMQVKILFTK